MSLKLVVSLFALTVSVYSAKAQCSGAPNFNVNLVGNPAGSWISPDHSRAGNCCSGSESNCTSFDVNLDPGAAMINLEILSGAIPSGSLYYKINCGPNIAVGAPICVTVPSPFTITFCKPGNNPNVYKITSIAKPTFPPDVTVRLGCTKALTTLGFNAGSISWNSIPQWAQPAGFYNSLLSSTTAASPIYTPTSGLPAYIDYRICGTPEASICGFAPVCDTVRIYNVAGLSASVLPASAGFCAGGSVTLTASASGGAAPYTYIWKNQSNVQVGTGTTYVATTAGTYALEVRDAIYDPTTCPALLLSVPVVVTQPPTVNAGVDQTVCTSSPTAYLSGSVTNATGGVWSGGAGTYTPNANTLTAAYTPTAGEIAAGFVNLTLTTTGAGGGCVNASDVVKINYPPLLINTLSSYTLACNASTINLSPVVSGGVAPYGYSWSNGSAAASINVGAGNYCVTITDAMGCSATSCSNITVPPVLNVSTSSTDVSVNGGSDGTATATPVGGTSPYTYLWSVSTTNQTTQTATGLSYGVHSVVVTDASGCTRSSSLVVNEPRCNGFSVSTGDVDILCHGSNTGSAFASVVGGTAPYTYSWNSSPVQTNVIAVGLTAGVYLVTVTEAGGGCIDIASATITEPTKLTNSITYSNVSAVGGSDGSATANPSGGTGAYTYSWSNSATTQSITGLTAGGYTVTVRDANNCSIVDSVRIVEPPCNFIVLNVYTTNVSCNGGSNGTAAAQMLFGTAPFSYIWSVGGQTTSAINALPTGPVSVLVTDALNCSQFKNITITEPSPLSLGLVSTDVICNEDNDGTLDLTVSGGTFPYTYLWTNSITVEDQANLSDGSYSVTVTDAAGCTAVTGTSISRPSALSATFTQQNVICKSGSDGAVDATVSGGIAPYTYSWSHGPTTQDITGLATGQYTLSVTDANGCLSPTALNIFINEPDSVDVDTFVVACPVPGSGMANVDVYPIGGDLGPYSISFTNGSTYLSFGDYTELLPVGTTYSVIVKDGNNCVSSLQLLTINPEPSISSITFANCNPTGVGTATVTVTPAGGAGFPYLVSTDNGGTFDLQGDYVDTLAIGNTYQVVIQDTLGCNSLASSIVIPDSISLSVTTSSYAGGYNISCNGLSDGDINLTESGGTTPFTFLWDDGTTTYTTEDLINIPAGNYTLTVTDANGCSKILVVPMTQPVFLAATASVTTNYNGSSVSCFGSTNGGIDLTVSGGTTAYTYSWSNSATTQDITGLGSGVYNVTVTDANSCQATATVTLTQPALLTNTISAATYNGQNISCNGLSDGSIDLTVAGGTTAYTYAWSNSATTQDISGLNANTYSVLITDVNGCTTTNTITLTQPAALTNTIAISSNYNGQNISCNGLSNGSIDLSVAGGTTNYTYSWSNSATTQDISGLNANTYSVLVTDVNGCTTTNTITLTQPTALTTTIAVSSNYNGQNVSCNGASDGSINLSVAGGTGAYTYGWSNALNTQDISGITAGTYSVLVTDVNGCTATNTITLTQPVALTTTIAVSSNYNGQNISCNGSSDGSINLTVAGGTTGYTYVWTNTVQTTQDITGLSANTYSVLVTDVNGCTATNTITVSQPTAISTTVAVSSNYNGQDISCNGLSDGSVDLSASGGTGAYTYSWSNSATTQDVSGLTANTYTVLVTDVNGCTATNTITLTEPALLTNTIVVSSNYNGQDISCNGLSDGSIDLSVAGGTTNYTYAWSNSSTTQDITGLNANTYTVLVTDVNGCTTTASITLSEPAVLTTSITVSSNYNGQDISCNGLSDGSLDLTVAGGTTNYTYFWSTSETTQDISGLSANNYFVQVTDANGCTSTSTITVSEPAVLANTFVLSNYNGQNISCNGLSDGSIDLSVTGGTTAYTYAWSNSATTQDVSGLTANTYSVLVTDVNGCTTTNTFTLTEPALLTNTIVVSSNYNGQDISCNGLSDGSIDLSVAGGTTLYTYAWSNSATTQDISGLNANTYSVLVTDVNGCTTTNTITLTEPVLLTNTIAISSNYNGQNVSCNGASDGSIDLTVAGGTVNYTYSWSNALNTQDISGITAGTYSVLVTDVNGCTTTNTITLTEPVLLTNTIVVSSNYNGQDISCNGLSDGSIDLSVAGGTTLYTYAWSNSQTTEDISGLSANTYSVLVTDVNGCTTINSITLTEPVLLTTTMVVSSNYNGQNISCNGASDGSVDLTVAGGTTSYTYAWSNSGSTQDISGLSAGTYSVLVTDVNGCTAIDSITVNEPKQPLLAVLTPFSYNGQNISCNGLSDGSIDLTASGGTMGYTYLWSNAQTTEDISGLNANTYSVLVTDVNGCTTTATVTLTEPAVLTTTVVVSSNYNGQDVSCYAQTDGSVDLTVTGGTPGYAYFWSTSATTEDISGLWANTYFVQVTDVNGCTSTNSITITQPALLTNTIVVSSNYNGQNISCNGLSDGSIDLSVSGGTTNYTYAWSNAQTTEDISGLNANTYSVLITDVNGCTTTNTITLTQPAVLSNTIAISSNYNGQNISCNGLSDGSIDLSVAGGTTNYTYAWSNSATTQDVSGLNANTYSVLVTDVNGCTTTNTITLTEPAALTNTIAISSNYNGQNVSCNGASNGSIDLSVAGGTTNYTYQWSNAQTTQDISGLIANTYSVLVTDVNGCTTTNTITLTQPVLLTNTVVVSSNYNGQNISCNGASDGAIDLSVSGGTVAYTYAWSNAQTTEDISGLNANTYSVLITDVNGCTTTNTITLTEPVLLTNTVVVSSNYNGQNISCNGASDGAIDLSVSGGTVAYTYSWSNAQTTEDISGLNANTYSVLITDVNGCTTTNTITISEPSQLTDTVTFSNVLCNGGNTGTATVSAAGATSPYTYLWSANASNQTTSTATGLSIGTYTVIVTDVNGCSVTDSITIGQPTQLLDSISVADVLCNGGNTGTASVFITGGMVPYTYSWSNGQTTTTISGLTIGQYIITATDSNGCVIIDTAVVGEPAALADSLVVSNVLCNGDSSGSASVFISGGMTPYSYLWTNSQTTSSVSGLVIGAYSVTVTDSNGCVLVVPVNITQPASLTSLLTPTGTSCNGGSDGSASATIIGGVTPYTYQWSANAGSQTTQTATGLSSGTYYITVLDSNGCSIMDSVFVPENSPVTLSVSAQNVSCNNASNGQIDITVVGGALPYSYIWSNGDTLQDLSGVPDGTYIVTVLDANLCSITDTVVLTQPDSLSIDLSSPTHNGGYNVSVFQGVNGAINTTVGGGTPPYTYFWTNGSSDQNLTGLAAGTYTVLVTDSNGCTILDSILLTEPFEFVMPTGISPNEDGKNDAFVVHGLDTYDSNTLQIFNRWGDEVYSVTNYQNDWKGTNKSGDALPDGTYFVILKVNNGEEKTLTGYVDLRR